LAFKVTTFDQGQTGGGAVTYPYIEISRLAKKESWRKEVNRPIYHLHKWWAQRLGSIFRANVIHAIEPSNNEWLSFYQKHDYAATVLDPFMGSGTTLGEALKVGCNVVGCDINPVSTFLVQEELRHVDLWEVQREYERIDAEIGERIRSMHRTVLPDGEVADVLYYFWVMVAKSPTGEELPLFKNYIVSKNAYPSKKPEIWVLCPHCGEVFQSVYTSHSATCPTCGSEYDPWIGRVKGSVVTDGKGDKYKIKDLVSGGGVPEERLYAMLAVDKKGNKHFLKASQYDLDLYASIESELKKNDLPIPQGEIEPGYNADQARAYGFNKWSDLYNARELLSLGLLAKSILTIENEDIRRQFLCLFDSTTEFNNRFCSYKGEGTGAVRPIFSNHILKPERTPVENSVWGFEKSSGCFSSLYRSRYLKAKEYLGAPFEIAVDSADKPICSVPIKPAIVKSFEGTEAARHPWALILNGDSGKLPIPDESVDAVITDPPYFDFVNYSELSDFFYAWLRSLDASSPLFSQKNSRRPGEVQRSDFRDFSAMLSKVFSECDRVMKPTAPLIFSFHHSRPEGWEAVANAIENSGLKVTEVYPVYAELSASTPKAAAKEPITIDMLIECRKKNWTGESSSLLTEEDCIKVLLDNGMKLSANDFFVIHSGFELLKA
jgi:putative DNA methylase